MARHGMSDRGWGFIKDFFPVDEVPKRGRPWVDHRKVLDGIFWILRTGAPWRDLPEEFGPWETVYGRFVRWSREGVLESVFVRILETRDEQKNIDWDLWCLDGSIIRAARCAAGLPKKTRSRTNRPIMPWVDLKAGLLLKSM